MSEVCVKCGSLKDTAGYCPECDTVVDTDQWYIDATDAPPVSPRTYATGSVRTPRGQEAEHRAFLKRYMLARAAIAEGRFYYGDEMAAGEAVWQEINRLTKGGDK